MSEFDGFKKTGRDSEIEERIQKHCQEYGIDALNAVKLFPVLARRQLLKRFLAHADLFKMTLEIPGDIAELGVFRGLGLMTWANLLEAYCIGDRTKAVYGFDNWKGFSDLSAEDGEEVTAVQKRAGGFSPGRYEQELRDAIAIFDDDRFIPWKPRVHLVKGDIEETVPAFLRQSPGVRFSLVHFDCDLYRPTRAALEALWPVLSRRGAFLFDEYAIADWPGETRAVEEFFADKKDVTVRKLQWNNTPGGYVVKP